jgi:CspA family cold shock protein
VVLDPDADPVVLQSTVGVTMTAVATTEKRCGVVKWFDFAKRFGFVTLDDDNVDAMLHLSKLKPLNIREVPKGSTGEFMVERTDKGLAVIKVLSLTPPESFINGSGYLPAVVKWFNHARGYGFLTLGEGTTDIFIHAVTVKASSLVELKQDQKVMIVVEPSDKGPKVIHIKAA